MSEEEREMVDGGQRGRPGRRSVAEKKDAVLALLSGKATVDQLALKYGVRGETIEKWRDAAMVGVGALVKRLPSGNPEQIPGLQSK